MKYLLCVLLLAMSACSPKPETYSGMCVLGGMGGIVLPVSKARIEIVESSLVISQDEGTLITGAANCLLEKDH